ncbi:MAG: emp24/gp25L/p24 family protein [Saprospiraceae bacterium]
MKNQNFKFGIVKAFLLFMIFLNVLHGQSPNYLGQTNTTIESKDVYTKKLKLKPKSSQSFSLKLEERKMITVQIAGGDLGSGRIVAEVYDPNGNMVASGSKEFSFNTKNIKGNYKFVVTNKTEDHQSVVVSVNTSGNYKM